MNVRIEASWGRQLRHVFSSREFEALAEFVRSEYAAVRCFPPAQKIFSAFDHCPFDKVKVVVLGQDPYHGLGQAHGLCFSVNDGVPFPPSLQNIFKEIQRDLGIPFPSTGNLERWAEQGVLLLNAVLTVREGQAASHEKKGWEEFTDEVIRQVNEAHEHVVFMLWGNYAQRKGAWIDSNRHCVLRSVHPSPLSAYRGFIGCGHFSQANSYLAAHGRETIQW